MLEFPPLLLRRLGVHEVLTAGVRVGEKLPLSTLNVQLFKLRRRELVLVTTIEGVDAFSIPVLFVVDACT